MEQTKTPNELVIIKTLLNNKHVQLKIAIGGLFHLMTPSASLNTDDLSSETYYCHRIIISGAVKHKKDMSKKRTVVIKITNAIQEAPVALSIV